MTSCCELFRKKLIQNWVRPPRPKRDVDTYTTCSPQNVAAKTLRSVERTPSKFGDGPCPVRPGLVVTVKCCVQKARFRCPGRPWNNRTKSLVLVSTPQQRGKPVLFSVFRSHHCRPYANNSRSRKQKHHRLSLCGVETYTRLWLLSFCSTEAEKTCFSYIALHRCRNSLLHRARVTTKRRKRMFH